MSDTSYASEVERLKGLDRPIPVVLQEGHICVLMAAMAIVGSAAPGGLNEVEKEAMARLMRAGAEKGFDPVAALREPMLTAQGRERKLP